MGGGGFYIDPKKDYVINLLRDAIAKVWLENAD